MFIVLVVDGIVYGLETIERRMIYPDFIPILSFLDVSGIVVLWWFRVLSMAISDLSGGYLRRFCSCFY